MSYVVGDNLDTHRKSRNCGVLKAFGFSFEHYVAFTFCSDHRWVLYVRLWQTEFQNFNIISSVNLANVFFYECDIKSCVNGCLYGDMTFDFHRISNNWRWEFVRFVRDASVCKCVLNGIEIKYYCVIIMLQLLNTSNSVAIRHSNHTSKCMHVCVCCIWLDYYGIHFLQFMRSCYSVIKSFQWHIEMSFNPITYCITRLLNLTMMTFTKMMLQFEVT